MSIRSRVLQTALVLGSILFVAPLAAQAIMYAPGQTLNPACAPTDPTCGVTTPFTLFQNGNVGIGTLVPTARLDVTGTNSTAVIGPEMIVATADRDFSSDTGKWTGTGWTIGSGVDTHTAGATALILDNTALSSVFVGGNFYQITLTTNTTVAGSVTPKIGGASGSPFGQLVGVNTQVITILAFFSDALTFTPNGTWAGTIDNVSIKQITPSSAVQIIRNSDGTVGLEIRSGGGNNTFIGLDSGDSNTTGSTNTGIGVNTLRFNTVGNGNTAIGLNSLVSNTTGIKNTSVGRTALTSNTVGGSNTVLGYDAMTSNITGSNNIAIGVTAMSGSTVAASNVAVGVSALANSSGISDIAVGQSALQLNTTGTNNVAVGRSAMTVNTTGNFNSALGDQSGTGLLTGSRNIFIGAATITASQQQVTTGSSNISIGNDVAVASSTLSNQLDIGNLIYGTGLSGTGASISPGSIGIGTSSPAQKLEVVGTIRQSGCITAGTLSANTAGDIICTPSSLRFKDNIQSVAAGLSEIIQLRPVSYHFKPELDMGSGTRMGFIAEEVASVTPEFATYDAKGAPYGLDTNAILAATVNAIKELDLKVNGGIPTAIAQSVSNVSQATNSLVSSSFDFIISQFNTALGVVWENGVLKIANVIADTLTAKEICVADNSGAKTCVDKARLDAILAGETPVTAPVVQPPFETIATTTPATTESTTTEVVPEATSTPLLPNTGATAAFNRTLDIGSTGADVAALQTILMQKGFLYLPVGMTPGYFGELTREAVTQYQTGNGLPPVGIVGPATRALLNAGR